MHQPSESQIPSLEALLHAVRDGVEGADWEVARVLKTLHQDMEGRAAGHQSRCVQVRFHRADLPDVVALEAHLEHGGQGLRGSVALVVKGPPLGEAGDARVVLCRASRAVREVMPRGYRAPLSLRMGLDSAEGPLDEGRMELRVGFHFPGVALGSGSGAVVGLVRSAVVAFERLLECPEIAELLPPVAD
jgi:hypothetical protein